MNTNVDPRLNEIDDSLYRVAVRALVMQDNKLLLVKELDGNGWWAIPGGGVDYGESVQACLAREIQEELGVSVGQATIDLELVLYNIGKVVNGIPRMNLYFRVSIPQELIGKTEHVEKWEWFTRDEFLQLTDLNPSYDKAELASVIFG